MSLNIDEQEARLIWLNDIMPFVFRHAKTQEKPVTVFLGGQPAAGKTSGQDLAKRLHPGIIPIVGDDYRQYHPDYRRLLKEDPLRMPDETAGLAGRWTGMCVDNADEWGYPIIIEGTWRNVATVLDEARRCKALRRATHAIVVATPPLVSRAGIIDRFCSGLLAGNTARWTPLEAHDRTVRALRSNVPLIAGSGLIDRFTSQVAAAIDQLHLALKTADTGERIRLLNGAISNTGNAIGQLAQFNADGTRRPPRREEPCPHYNVK